MNRATNPPARYRDFLFDHTRAMYRYLQDLSSRKCEVGHMFGVRLIGALWWC